MEKHSDQRIKEWLRSSRTEDNEAAIRYLHGRVNEQVARLILQNSGGPADVDDIFQEGLIVLYKLAKNGEIEKVANVEAYLYSVCRNLWLKRLRRDKREVALTEEQEDIPVAEVALQSLLSDERQAALRHLLSQLGDSCRQILIWYYYDRLSMKEIAERMNYSGDQVAKNKKSNCLKKLRQAILDSPHFRSLLKNAP